MAARTRALTAALPAVDTRYVVGALVAALAAVLVLTVTRPPERTAVLVVAQGVAAGTTIDRTMFTTRLVESDEGLVPSAHLDRYEGWTLAVPLAVGDPVLASLLMPPEIAAAPNAIALSLPPEHAVLGRIGPGDFVDVYVTDRTPMGEVTTELVASEVYVVAASIADDTISGGNVEVLLAVDDDLAPVLASAARADGVDLVRVAK